MLNRLDLMYALGLIVLSPWILWRRVTQGRYRRGWRAKLWGEVGSPLPGRPLGSAEGPASRPRVLWFHAVSVGELQVIRPLIEAVVSDTPDVRIVVTTSTDSGHAMASKLYAAHTVCYAPLDFSWAVRRAVARIEPCILVLTELELWPNWIREVRSRGIPIAVVNARLSESSLKGYQWLGGWFTTLICGLDWIGAQSENTRQRFLELGCDPQRVVETGNIKFDGATPDRQHPEVTRRRSELGLRGGEIVWLCGSTQSPEEQLCLDVFCKLSERHPSLKLLLVPRHAERFEEVANLVSKTGLAWQRRSQMTEGQTLEPDAWKIFLADSVGELRWWWGLAEIGFVGGSFGSRGGQNMIEPCAYGVATCFGPNTTHFSDVVQILLDARGAEQLQQPADLEPWVESMLNQPKERQAIAARAREVTHAQRGAVARTWRVLSKMLTDRMSPKG
jgi:3-deoxy-D-manno-octulosonic-acid transferase